jgi:tetratricopeptide (TPR) repeat protein
MTPEDRARRQQIVRQAEGYLELGMPRQALETFDRWQDPETLSGSAHYLKGEALRALERYQEATDWLERALEYQPAEVHVMLALGWCYKRTGRLDNAIEILERAATVEPEQAIVHYNLACYWSLAHDKGRSLEHLARAFEFDGKYRELVHDEPDFDFVRDDPEFQSMTSLIA